MRIPEKWSPVLSKRSASKGALKRLGANRTRLTYSRNRKTIGGDSERGRRRSIGYSVAARPRALRVRVQRSAQSGRGCDERVPR